MKKVCFLILSLLLCLSLCACGGMDGAKAAELYPDIIGQWGTDPFGEEFVLTLSKDGSCTVLGTDGTWTLNEKNSNEEWVELTIKTEAMKYYVELDRVQDGMDNVHLWISDIKRETTVYEGYVFPKGDQYIFSDLALQTVPELVGEWGSIYWHEEPVLTIKEDGTCTLLRHPGRWCLYAPASTWPDIHIVIKLDNGMNAYLSFLLEPQDWGYLSAYMNVVPVFENSFVWPDPEMENTEISVINRSQVIHPLDFASIAVGEWAESEDKKSFATFREDGTCTIRGAEGLWSLDYTAYYREKFRNGWDYCLHAKINGDQYDICFSNPDDNGIYYMYIINQDDDIYILDATNVIKVNEG